MDGQCSSVSTLYKTGLVRGVKGEFVIKRVVYEIVL